MADQPVRWTPLGNLDKDTEFKLVNKGNYTDALDIIKQDDGENVSATIQPTKRNKHAFSLGEVQAQNKKYRVTVSGDNTKNHGLQFLSTKRDARMINGSGVNGEIVFNGTISSLQSAFFSSNQPGIFNVSVSGNSMEFEYFISPHYQWYLESVGDDDVEVVCIQEAIPTDLAGPLKDIGSYDLLGDLFVFSTTQDNEPTELEVQIAGVGPVQGGNYVGPLTQLFFNGPHGLQQGQWIRITDASETWLNGLFVVHNVVSPTDIQIVTDTAWGVQHNAISVSDLTVYKNPIGIGEIGVAKKGVSNQQWSYTRLLRSVELNFVSKHAIRIDSREKGGQKIHYYTDKYNQPRKFGYKGEYVTDGALKFVSSQNNFVYDFISDNSSLLASDTGSFSNIEYIGQSDSGGNLMSGNKYYIYRFLDNEGTSSNWSKPTRAISVFPRSLNFDDPVTVKGGSPEEQTSKSVNLLLSGIPQGVFSEVEFAVIESDSSGGLSGTVFKKVSLSEEQQSINVSHNGNEEEQLALDVGELATSIADFVSIKTVGDLSIIDGRLVMGNITYQQVSDLEKWSSQFKHEIKKWTISGLGRINDEKIGGYLDPTNVYKYPSLTLYETYRVGVDVEFTDGTSSPTFWVDDIRVDTLAVNQANPNDNRRVVNGGLDNYALNDDDERRSILVPYIVFSNINPDFLVGGVPIKNLISSLTFRFANIEKEVLASGFVVMGISGKKFTSPVQLDGSSIIGAEIGPDSNHHCQYLDWSSSYRVANNNSILESYAAPDLIRKPYPNAYTEERKTAFFYSPEISMGNLDDYERQASDKINIYYPVARSNTFRTTKWNGYYVNTSAQIATHGPDEGSPWMLPSDGAEITASPASAPNNYANANSVEQYQIDDAQIMNPGESNVISGETLDTYHVEESKVGGGSNGANAGFAGAAIGGALGGVPGVLVGAITSSVAAAINGPGTAATATFVYDSFEISHSKCLAIRSNSDMFPSNFSHWQSNNADYGIYYAQLFRDRGPNKYGEKEITNYQPYGSKFPISDISNENSKVDVFGGDAFIVKTLLRNRYSKEGQENNPVVSSNAAPTDTPDDVGRHFGVTYFAQSYLNMELVNPPDDVSTIFSYPESFPGAYIVRLRDWLVLNEEYKQFYNEKYSYGLSQLNVEAYSEELNDSLSDVPTRIVFSTRDIYSSLADNMRTFLPINFKDLDGTFGPIEVVENINGELFTLQPRKYQLQYFNTRGTLQGSNEGVEVLIGDASVLGRDGQTLSSYGTQHKWSVVKGSSQSGKDVIYWFNQENGLFMRFGADGTVVLSERHGMRSFSANKTKWTEGQHSPALNYGIRSVWDDRFKEAIWTFTGIRKFPKWEGANLSIGPAGSTPQTSIVNEYLVGQAVTNDTYVNYEFEQIPDVYVCIQSHFNSTPSARPGVGSDWESYWRRVEKDNPEYYTVFTLAFNELSNGFSTFYSHIPKTYLKWKNKFLSSHPTQRSEIYEHRDGYDKWYEYEGVWKESEPYIEGVVNPFPDQSKKFVAIQSLSDNVPDRIEFKTKDHESFLVSSDFDPEDDTWRSPVKNDILTSQTGDPNDDTESLVGSYMRVKFKFFNGAYNKLNNLIVKVRQRLRRTQS